MKRLIRASRTRKDLWEDIIYIYDLVVNQGREDYADEYTCAYINYELSGGSKGLNSSGKKYRDLYLKLSGPDSIKCSKTVKIGKGKFEGTDATLLSEAQYESQKKYLDYQFRRDGYKYYTKPGKEQYTWRWYAVPSNDETRNKE